VAKPKGNGQNTADRKMKQEITDLKQKLKKLQRTVQQLKSARPEKTEGRARKKEQRVAYRESELVEIIAEVERSPLLAGKPAAPCLSDGCGSLRTKEIHLGKKTLVMCEECGSRQVFDN